MIVDTPKSHRSSTCAGGSDDGEDAYRWFIVILI